MQTFSIEPPRPRPVIPLRRALAALLTSLAALALPSSGWAQAWPSKPIRIVVPFPAGSTTDLMARAVGEQLRLKLGQPTVIENRPGANGLIGAAEVARAQPDGYTLLATNSSSITVNPQLYKKATYQAERDFTPLSMVVSAPFILVVHPTGERTTQVQTVSDLVAQARAMPDKVTYGSGGPGNLAHLTFAMLGNRAGVSMTHVPYKGAAAAQVGLMAREIDAMFDSQHGMANIKAGKVRAIAVTSSRRIADLPEVPTMAEAGYPGFEVTFWLGLLLPAGTPQPVVERLYEAVRSVRENPAALKQLENQGTVELTDPQSFATRIRGEVRAWGEVIRREKIELD